MKLFLMLLLGADMLAVIVVMLVGALGMTSTTRTPQTSNMLMRARVALQGFGVILVVLLFMTGR